MSKPTPGSINLVHGTMQHNEESAPTEQNFQTTNEENEIEIEDSTSA